MARYLKAKCRLCRREGVKLFIKGARCNTEKCGFTKRPNPPGMAKNVRYKPSYYALQLREKQKTKRLYGMLEKQFRRFFALSHKAKGVTGKILLQMLERRLDNVIYRSLLANSRNQARQIIRHGFVYIKGKRVDIPSYIVDVSQELEIRPTEQMGKLIKANVESSEKSRSVPTWMQVDHDNRKVTIVRLPEKEDIGIEINEQLIVELYSK